jgi:hypothetical protein
MLFFLSAKIALNNVHLVGIFNQTEYFSHVTILSPKVIQNGKKRY